MTGVLLTLGLLLLLNLAVGGVALWLIARRLGGTHTVGYRRAQLAAVVVFVVQTAVLSGLAWFGWPESDLGLLYTGWAGLAVGVVVPLLAGLVVLRLSPGRALLVMLPWVVLMGVWGLGLIFVAQTFLVEGAINPSGNMAPTVRGAYREIVCPSCQHAFAVNAEAEANPREDMPPRPTVQCVCPDCRLAIRLVRPDRDGREPHPGQHSERTPFGGLVDYREVLDPGWVGGDRFFVGKGPLGYGLSGPARLDLVVFDYPPSPTMRYVKRLFGLPGETVGIKGGDVFVLPADPRRAPQTAPPPAEEAWQPEHMFRNEPQTHRLLGQPGHFEIVRKPPDLVLALAHLVHEARRPGEGEKERWTGEGWQADDAGYRAESGKPGEWSTLRYRHLLRGEVKPTLVTDFSAYNSHAAGGLDPATGLWVVEGSHWDSVNWVGDLMLECEVDIASGEGQFQLELVRGGDVFRAVWDLAKGDCTLVRAGQREPGGKNLDTRPTNLRQGRHRVRFANVDRRLIVWVDDDLVFGDGVAWEDPSPGPTEDDLKPAAVAVSAAQVALTRVRLLRDNYWVLDPMRSDVEVKSWSALDAEDFQRLRNPPWHTFFVQPGHYFCLGDNSPRSSDSRNWGVVPERMLVGKVRGRYYPFARAGALR